MSSDFKVNDRVHSALYKLGRVTKIGNQMMIVTWDRKGYDSSIYLPNGKAFTIADSYQMIQKLPDQESFSEEELESIEKWQTEQMDIFFKIPKKINRRRVE